MEEVLGFSLSALFQPIALAVHLEDMDVEDVALNGLVPPLTPMGGLAHLTTL